jgi:hypothetical protein
MVIDILGCSRRMTNLLIDLYGSPRIRLRVTLPAVEQQPPSLPAISHICHSQFPSFGPLIFETHTAKLR